MLTTYVVTTIASGGAPAAIMGTATNGEAPEDAAVDEDRRDEREGGDETVAQGAVRGPRRMRRRPRQKNARSTNRTTPTSRIASEELQIMRRSQRVSRT